MSKHRPLEVRCNEVGFKVTAAGSSSSAQMASVAWDDVEKIFAYKNDLYVIDLVCLASVMAERTVEVHEEMQGWSQFVEMLPSLLPGTPPMSERWERVAKPPFAPSVTTIFERA